MSFVKLKQHDSKFNTFVVFTLCFVMECIGLIVCLVLPWCSGYSTLSRILRFLHLVVVDPVH